MFTKSNFLVIIVLAFFMAPFLADAQATVGKKSAESIEAETWQPLKFTEDGNNVKSNVAFYVLKSQCNSQDVYILRLNNSNTYPVKVEWQLNAESGKTTVVVAPVTDLQGNCLSVNGKNSSDLVMPAPKTEEEVQKIKEYFIAHLIISQVKN